MTYERTLTNEINPNDDKYNSNAQIFSNQNKYIDNPNDKISSHRPIREKPAYINFI